MAAVGASSHMVDQIQTGVPGSARVPVRTSLRFAPIGYLLGLILAIITCAMLVPAVYAWIAGIKGGDAFALAATITGFVAGLLWLGGRGQPVRINIKQMYLLTVLSWVLASLFSALPILFHHLGLGITDSFFEAISGLTTTGSTVITGLDRIPRDVLLWRALLQWLGGLGIIVMAMAALPALRIGGMELFHTESSDRSEKIFPSPTRFIYSVFLVYATLTVCCAAAYEFAGMPGFDAILHAMTTLSTGGYSTHDASLGFYDSPAIQWIAVVFMLAGALPFVLYVQYIRGKRPALVSRGQVAIFLAIIALSSLAIAVDLRLEQQLPVEAALRQATFSVVSIITTTGYVTSDYGAWGGLPVAVIFVLMYLGGCTGSTSGGIKIFRLQVIYSLARAQVARQIMPHQVVARQVEGRTIEPGVADSVLAFVGLYIATIIVVMILLAALGLDFTTALSSAVTSLGNVGPGLGETVGPAGHFGTLPEAAKWVLSGAMLLGRLELMTVLVVLTRAFWREW